MKAKTLVKAKIVLEDNGTALTTYLWKTSWWIFGHWYPFGSSSSNQKVSPEKIGRINDEQMSKVLFKKFITGH